MDTNPNPIQTFRHQTLIQVRFKDVDMMGHVNNSNHITYFEMARVNYFNEIIAETIQWNSQGIILAHMEIDYKQPLLLTDEVRVYSRVSKFGNSSFEFKYCITRKDKTGEHLAATGKSVQVCFDYNQSKAIAVPKSWKEKVKAFEIISPDE